MSNRNPMRDPIERALRFRQRVMMASVAQVAAVVTLAVAMAAMYLPLADLFQRDSVIQWAIPFGAAAATIAMLAGMLWKVVQGARVPPQVFVSFASGDRAFADELVSQLRLRGVNVMRAEDTIRVGDDITARLRELISRCTHAVIIASNDYEKSRWQAAELALMGSRVKIVPVLYKRDTPLPGLETIQHARADSINDNLLSELTAALPHLDPQHLGGQGDGDSVRDTGN